MGAVHRLDGTAGGDRKIGAVRAYQADTLRDSIEGSGDAADFVVNLRRPIEGDDGVIDVLRDLGGETFEQQSGREQRDADAASVEIFAEIEKIRVHERLATREDDPLDVEIIEVGKFAKVAGRVAFPDVAHNAPAVAAAGDVEDEDREVHVETRFPARRISGPRAD